MGDSVDSRTTCCSSQPGLAERSTSECNRASDSETTGRLPFWRLHDALDDRFTSFSVAQARTEWLVGKCSAPSSFFRTCVSTAFKRWRYQSPSTAQFPRSSNPAFALTSSPLIHTRTPTNDITKYTSPIDIHTSRALLSLSSHRSTSQRGQGERKERQEGSCAGRGAAVERELAELPEGSWTEMKVIMLYGRGLRMSCLFASFCRGCVVA